MSALCVLCIGDYILDIIYTLDIIFVFEHFFFCLSVSLCAVQHTQRLEDGVGYPGTELQTVISHVVGAGNQT